MDTTYVLTSDGALMHYGVKGMKWGVRQAREAGRELDRKQNVYMRAKYMRDKSVRLASKQRKGETWDDVARKSDNYNRAKNDYQRAKREFNENAPTRAKAERGAKKTALALAAIGTAYVVDKKFLGGVGSAATKIAAESAVKVIGMTAITAYEMARGGSNISWKV